MNRLDDIIEGIVRRIVAVENSIEAIRVNNNPGIFTAIATIAALTNANALDGTLFVSSSLGAYTINLPTAVGVGGRIYIIKDDDGNANANNITINATGGQNIDGIGSYTITANYGRVGLQSNGTNWRILFT